jgi:hypothetical protein
MYTRRKLSVGLLLSMIIWQANAHTVTKTHDDDQSTTAHETSEVTNKHDEDTSNKTATEKSQASNAQHDKHVQHVAKTKHKSWGESQTEAASLEIPKNIQESSKHLMKTMEEYWDSWTEGTGKLTITRIGQLLDNPNITGRQAAALGALVDYFYKLNRSVTSLATANSTDAFTLKQLKNALQDLTGNNRANEVFADDYRKALIQIRDDTTKDGFSLYGKKNPPEFGENVQWNVCDCYFVSAVNAMLKQDPNLIVQMIKQTGPDTFEVYFPGYKDGKVPVKVRLTQGDIAMFSHTRDGGCYLAVLGRATDEVMRKEKSDSNKVANQTPIGTVVDEGSHWVETRTFHLLTGKNYTQIKVKDYTTAQLNEMIEYAIAHHEFIGLDVGSTAIGKHYLIITGIHDGMVDVLNPWGVNGWYAPKGGGIEYLPNLPKPTGEGPVFKMVNGHFQVPLKEIDKSGFGGMTFQDRGLKAVMGDDKS